MIWRDAQDTCLRGGEHQLDFGAATIEVDRNHAYLALPCIRCGAWATLSTSNVRLEWGEPED